MFFYAVKNGNQTGIVDSILFLKQKDEKYFVLMLPLKYNYESEQLLGLLSGMKKADPSRYNELLEYIAAESLCKFLIQHANPIDLGGNGTFDKIGVAFFPYAWKNF